MMRNLRKFLFRFLMLSFAFGFTPGAQSGQPQSLVEANTAFALDLYGQLKSGQGNLLFSPFSISTALAMTFAGARGDTERQMAGVLHFDRVEGPLHSSFDELQRQLGEIGKQKGIELNMANALWTERGHPFLPGFLKIAQDQYGANLNQVEFKTGAAAARNEINRWVEQKTKQKIHDILPPGSVDALTRLVLANAVYFKGAWVKPFVKAETSSQPFHLSATHQIAVPLMHHFDEIRYMEDKDFQAAELPYSGGQLSMVILLPRQIDAWGSLEDRLNPALLSRALGQMRQHKVEIFLPRFKLECAFDLNDVLSRMGMPDAFGGRADFSGMDGTRLLYISGVFHKAWGEVNEEGTEAAAATAVTAVASAVMKRPPPPPIFRADQPFLFFIRDTHAGSLLFLGRLSDPSH